MGEPRVTGIGPIPRPAIATVAAGDGDLGPRADRPPAGHFARGTEPVDTAIYWRPSCWPAT